MVQVALEIDALKDNLLDMIELVENQLAKCKKVIENKDAQIAREVITGEKKVDVQELAILKDCENIIALHNPVATDLRFVLATLKISNDLERIADNAYTMARFLKKNITHINEQLFIRFEIVKMLEVCVGMLNDMHEALKKEETKLAHKVFDKDEELNKINKKSNKTARILLKEYPNDQRFILRLFTIVKNLERVGDLTKNIGEEIVFHIEARILKHKHDKGSDGSKN